MEPKNTAVRIRTPWDGLGPLEEGEKWLEEDGLEGQNFSYKNQVYGPLKQEAQMKPRTLELDDFDRRDTESISELVHDALIDLGYNVSSFFWSIKVTFTSDHWNE